MAANPDEPAAPEPPPPPSPYDPNPEPAAVRPTNPRTVGPDGGTVNGDPEGPRAEALNAVLAGAMPRFQDCFDRADLPVGVSIDGAVSYSIEPYGRASLVRTTGALPRVVDLCVQNVAANLRFPEFHGPAVTGSLPLSYRRDTVR